MALNQAFFDAIDIEVVKKKYYNANKVNALLDDIRTQAFALSEENDSLREQLRILSEKKAEIGEALMGAQVLAKRIIEQANARADEIVRDAEKKRDDILKDSSKAQEYAAQSVEAVIEELKAEHRHCIDLLTARWQSFLCGLDDGATPETAAAHTQPCDKCAPADVQGGEEALPELVNEQLSDDEDDNSPLSTIDPAELESRVAAIAKELYEIMG